MLPYDSFLCLDFKIGTRMYLQKFNYQAVHYIYTCLKPLIIAKKDGSILDVYFFLKL